MTKIMQLIAKALGCFWKKNYCSYYRDLWYPFECNAPWPRNDKCRFFGGMDMSHCRHIGCATYNGAIPCRNRKANAIAERERFSK